LWISATFIKAIDKICNPVEDGLSRYAEIREWQVPHDEKITGLNAATFLLLYKVN